MKKYSVIIFALLISCISDTQNNKTNLDFPKLATNRPNLNLSIILDLSDRISPDKDNMKDYDLDYINDILFAFSTHIVNKRVIRLNDNINYFILPPGDLNADQQIRKINYHIDRSSSNCNKDSIISITSNTIKTLNSIYDNRISYASSINWDDGADLWGFMHDKSNDLCVENNFKNKIIIITDGYIWSNEDNIVYANKTNNLIQQDLAKLGLTNSNWEDIYTNNNYGFITLEQSINADVLIIGLDKSTNNPYSLDILKKYWTDWLEESVNLLILKEKDVPSNIKPVIEKFIWE
ncbi:MAG: hypothetical protein H8E55_20630 [Pelagibacterales bacterium]|nr:hypothetical protein [Pelagibacterales bacterium]